MRHEHSDNINNEVSSLERILNVALSLLFSNSNPVDFFEHGEFDPLPLCVVYVAMVLFSRALPR